LFLLTAFDAAFPGKKAPKLAETVDLPATFDVDYRFAAKQRAQLGPQKEVPDDTAGRVGQEVFDSLVKTQMISSYGLPYTWRFKPCDSPTVNAFSLADGEVVAYTGLSRLIGTDRGLWAAVLAHEIAHVARRHAAKKALFHEYVEEQVRYWQMRASLGDKGAGWTELAVRIAGNLAEKKLSRDLELDADIQGMMLMARAGYHPDNAFAMHHLLRMNTPERSKVGTFFFSDHPRWESRDQRTERAYTEALAEYNQLWVNPELSPGGAPPAVAFLGDVRGVENKGDGTGDLTIPLSCRNVGTPVGLVIRLTKSDGTRIQTSVLDYRDPTGKVTIRERGACPDKDSPGTTVVHIPTAVIPAQDRRLKAQIEVLGLNDQVLELSKVVDVHFPKADKKTATAIAKVRVEPELRETPGFERGDQYRVAEDVAPAAVNTQSSPVPPVVASVLEQPKVDVAAITVATGAEKSGAWVGVGPVVTRAEPLKSDRAPNPTTREALGILPSAIDGSGLTSNWKSSLAPVSSATWWRASSPVQSSPQISLARSSISFPVEPVDTESPPTSIVITNHAPIALSIARVTITGTDSSDFTAANHCASSVEPEQSCSLWVRFRPTANGTRSAVLTIDGETQKVVLAGIGK
jgi:hypothetical protein